MSGDAAEALFKTIDERRDELVELTRALIGFPTVNPPERGISPARNSSASACAPADSPSIMCMR